MYQKVRVKVHVLLATAVLVMFLLSPAQSAVNGNECPPTSGQTCGG
ncbi:MAG: hypothetical protein H6667_17560 [Ardenticatenaceae bacterium]|nr:hypothetical protein [Ardenticatenaceae bacterium]MCB9443261.1 hypothetical protein [Ardenticatenaceae bacterium]